MMKFFLKTFPIDHFFSVVYYFIVDQFFCGGKMYLIWSVVNCSWSKPGLQCGEWDDGLVAEFADHGGAE